MDDDDDLSSAEESCYLSIDESIDEEEEVVLFTCEICIEPMRENNKFNNGDGCSHPFCFDCIAKYIEAKMEEHIADLPCPATNCDKLLEPLSCRPIISAGLFEKWCDVLCEFSVVRSRDQSLYAYCPFTECSTLVLNECEGDIVTRTECLNCKKLFCFQCKIPWHAGFDCNETEQLRDENDILFGELAARNKWMKCPGCNFRVEKIEGCPNITCRCKVLFCYTCGKIKNECVCYRATAGGRVEAYVDHNRRHNGCMNSCFCNFIFNLLVNALFIGLIVGLGYIKGSKAANIISTILVYVYNIFVLPCTLYSVGKSCCCPNRR